MRQNSFCRLVPLCIFLASELGSAWAQAPDLVWLRQIGGTNADMAGGGIATDAAGNVFVSGGFGSPGASFGTTNMVSRGGDDIFLAQYNRQGNLLWLQQAGGASTYGPGTSGDACYSAATDGAGNVYIAGYFYGTATFGGTNLVSRGGNDIYVVKYDSAGNLLWARRAGGSYHDTALHIAVDAAGNCYVPGFFRGTADFGSFNVTDASTLYSDSYLAKYDSTGNVLWIETGGGPKNDVSYSAAFDVNGNVYVSGYFQGTMSLGSTNVTASGIDVFLAKYDGGGSFQWVQTAGGNAGGSNIGRSVSVDRAGDVWLTGSFRGPAVFGSTLLAGSGNDDVFVAKYSPNGVLYWARQAGGAGNDVAHGQVLDTANNLYISGSFTTNAQFGAISLTATGTNGQSDIFLAKYDSAGNVLWGMQAGSRDGDGGGALAMDPFQTLYGMGIFAGTASFEGQALTSFGSTDGFVARWDEIPLLRIRRSNHQAVVSWTTNAYSWALQTSTNLNSAASWEDSTNAPAIIGAEYSVTNTPGPVAEFFRLHKP